MSSIDAFAYVLLAKMGSFKRAFNWFDSRWHFGKLAYFLYGSYRGTYS